MVQVVFEEQDVRDQLCELFEFLAALFQEDHWKLTDRQARMLSGPTTQLLSSIWAKLLRVVPDVIARWCNETPGAAAFLVTAGIVVIPKAAKQLAISKQKARQTQRKSTPVTASDNVGNARMREEGHGVVWAE